MPNRKSIAAALAATAALAITPAVAATRAPDPTPSSSSSASTASVSSTSGASSSLTSVQDGAIPVSNPIELRLDDKGQLDNGPLPSPETVFTLDELKKAVPGLTSIDASDDSLLLMIKGEPSNNRSQIAIKLPRFGKTADVQKAWNTEKATHRERAQKHPNMYTFYGEHKFGVADSFSDGTTTHVLLTNGGAAGEVWFSGVGFSQWHGDHASSRRAYDDVIVPKLIRLLGDKVKAGGPASASSSTSAAPSSTPSPKP